jgi:branched-chain amino acid transport system permease protein
LIGWLIFAVGVLTIAGIYAIFAMILNLEAGWAGLWDLGIAGLLAVGAYFYVIVTLEPGTENVRFAGGWPMWAGILGAGAFTGLVALVIGIPSLRLRGEYFLITTFAFAEVIRQILINQTAWTKGTVGFSQIDRPFDELVGGRNYAYVLLGLVAVVALLVYLLMRRIGRSPFGRVLRAFRDNEPVALALGKHVTRYRVQTFVLAGVLFGTIAPLYVWYIRSAVPQVFTADVTFTAWTALVVGGIASTAGPAAGAIVLIAATEALQFIPVSVEHATLLASTRPMLLGLALILVLRVRPEGLVPERWSFRDMSERLPQPDERSALSRLAERLPLRRRPV